MALAQKTAACASRTAARSMSVARPALPVVARPAVRAARKAAPATRTVARVLPMEVAQIAGEAEFIGGVALTMTAITLVGLAIGFVLLRVESLAEEGKL